MSVNGLVSKAIIIAGRSRMPSIKRQPRAICKAFQQRPARRAPKSREIQIGKAIIARRPGIRIMTSYGMRLSLRPMCASRLQREKVDRHVSQQAAAYISIMSALLPIANLMASYWMSAKGQSDHDSHVGYLYQPGGILPRLTNTFGETFQLSCALGICEFCC